MAKRKKSIIGYIVSAAFQAAFFFALVNFMEALLDDDADEKEDEQ
jgi:uncharacterized protein (DUF697 family)